jgi:HlyD family secretion protein
MTRSVTLILALLVLAACDASARNGRVVASGHIEASQVRISTKVRGRLLKRPVDEGDTVTAGQTIAILDTIDTDLALREAVADREQADAQLRLLLAGSRKEDIAASAATAASIAADLAGAEKELERQQSLLEQGISTAADRDDALARRDTLKGQLESAQQAHARAKAGSRAQEIEAARATRDAMEARIGQLKQQIADATIVSPVAGRVTEKIAEPGELLAAGSPIVVVTALDHPWLTVYVGEPDLGKIRLGASAEVVTDGGERREGKVTFVASTAEFTPKNVQTRDERVKLVYRIKVGLDNADGLFKTGMPAEAHF